MGPYMGTGLEPDYINNLDIVIVLGFIINVENEYADGESKDEIKSLHIIWIKKFL